MNSLTEDLGVALFMMIVAALLGGLLVWLWFRNRYARLEDRNNQLAGEASDLRSRFGALEDQHKLADQKARDCSEQLDPIRANLSAKEKALATAEGSIVDLQKQIAELTPFKVEFEDLQHRYNTLEDSVRELQGKVSAKKTVEVAPSGDTASLAEELAREKAVRLSLTEQLEGLRPFRQKYEDLKLKFNALSAQAPSAPAKPSEAPASRSLVAEQPAATPKPEPAPAPPATPKKKKESQEETLARIQDRAKEINFDRIGVATAADKDDLKIVKGIGPFLEKKLNSIGIYTFRQIAAFTPEDEDKVNEVIEFFPGRIRRDNWSSQAEVLHKEKEEKKEEKD